MCERRRSVKMSQTKKRQTDEARLIKPALCIVLTHFLQRHHFPPLLIVQELREAGRVQAAEPR